MTRLNTKVTEKVLHDFSHVPEGQWLVHVEWDGGHNARRFQLQSVFDDETEATEESLRLASNPHAWRNYSAPAVEKGTA